MAKNANAKTWNLYLQQDGRYASFPDPGGGSVSSDWLLRSQSPGVVWKHAFDADAEVNNFRWTASFGSGNDPAAAGHATAADVRRITSDAPPGSAGCLEIIRRAGTAECQSVWWRPFVPVTSPGNGLASSDVGDGGKISPLSYVSTAGGSQIADIVRGYYGHSSYVNSNFDGTEFYLQMRVKMDPARMSSASNVGKLLYLTTTYRSLTSQEIVTYSRGDGGDQGSHNYFRMYGGASVSTPLDQEVSPSDGIQPGSAVAADWYWSGGWDTVMYHLVMGRTSVDETRLEVYAAHEGDSDFTKIWNQTFAFNGFEWNNGINALIASVYNNSNSITADFYHRYGQMVLSKQFVPPPRDTAAPAWFEAAADLTWIRVCAGSGYGSAFQNGNRLQDVAPSPSPPGAEGQSAIMNDWTGACAHQGSWSYFIPAQGGHNGYYGNEVYRLRLRADVPSWERIWGPTPNANISTSEYSPSYNPAYTGYSDGAPRTSHGWYSLVCTRDGRIITTFQDANPSGTWDTGCYSLDTYDTGAGWTFHGRLWATLPGVPGSEFLYQVGPGGYDRRANKFYRAAEGAVGSPANGIVGVDVNTMLLAGPQSTSTGPQAPGSTLHNVAYGTQFSAAWSVVLEDASPPCWVCASNSGTLKILDLTNPAAGWTTVSTSGSPDGFGAGLGAVYHRGSNSILVGGKELGNNVRKLSISGSNPKTATYTWSNIAISGTAPTSDAGYQGTFGKFQIIDDLGNGQSAIVMATEVDGPTYVLKLPETL